ncbi:MAG: flagellar biosynthetic protein FliR [Pseudomonadota bacterium]
MTIELLPELAFIFMMVFARIGVIAMLMPAVGAESVPVRVRLTIAILITFILVPIVGDTFGELPGSPFALFLALALEMLIGLFIGMSAALLTSALQVAGTTIAFQTSLSAAQNTDVSTAVQGTLVANFFNVVSLALIFAMDVHHLVIAAMHDSYTLFPPGGTLPIGDVAQTAVNAFAHAFLIGVQISAPFLLIGFIFNVGSGILARLMPQFQVLLVLLPANLMIGFLFMFALIGTMMMWYIEHLRAGLSVFIVQ